MEKILDIIFTKRSVLRTNDPYSLALAVREVASQYGTIKEKVHEYDTNGPRKIIRLNFDLRNRITKHTMVKLAFMLKGEIGIATSFLEVKVIGKSITAIDVGYGFTSQVYGEYYLKSIFPLMRKECESRLREIAALVEHDIKNVLHKYT